MTLSTANSNYYAAESAAEKQYFADLFKWAQTIKPDVQTLEFESNWESDDEGGSDPYFSSLYMDSTSLEDIVKNMTAEEIKGRFKIAKYYEEDLEGDDEDAKWDAVRDGLDFPRFARACGEKLELSDYAQPSE